VSQRDSHQHVHGQHGGHEGGGAIVHEVRRPPPTDSGEAVKVAVWTAREERAETAAAFTLEAVEGRVGFEPTTRGLKVPCSAAELPAL
jgi:hypothetical protein